MTVAALVVAFACLFLAAWLRTVGTTITRIPRADALRDASEDVGGASTVADLLDRRELIPPAVGMVSSGLLVISAVVGMAVLGGGADLGRSIGIALGVGLVVFIVGDLLPRQVGRRIPKTLAYRSAGLLKTVVRIGGWANELLPDSEEDEESTTPEEDEADEAERELIDSVLEFGETVVREVMTPRPDMTTIAVNETVDDLISVATDEGYSRVPVTSNGDVVGMIIIKDLLPMLGDGQRPQIADVMRPVDFVPESKLASALLAEMQANATHQMIVVDEYGDVAGLVTIEDLLEELVGEIADETDDEDDLIVAKGSGVWEVDARVSVDDLEDVAGVELPDDDWDTVGGLVLGLAERVPEEGEEFAYGPLTLTVTRMQGRRVSEVLVAAQSSVETS
jgi:CBS domain containing-hemolysin-like protein